MSGNPYHPKRRLRATGKAPPAMVHEHDAARLAKAFAEPIEYAKACAIVHEICSWGRAGSSTTRWLLGWGVLTWVEPVPAREKRAPRSRCPTCTTRAACSPFSECAACFNSRIRALVRASADQSRGAA
ncbi:MAG TPA: hypothetical protein VGH28_13980 [Polyangiaceae bacterium]